jgi:hypothetical protein
MLATCTDGLIGIRDRALLLFSFSSGGRRRRNGTFCMNRTVTSTSREQPAGSQVNL